MIVTGPRIPPIGTVFRPSCDGERQMVEADLGSVRYVRHCLVPVTRTC
jgi:hypothetical protein